MSEILLRTRAAAHHGSKVGHSIINLVRQDAAFIKWTSRRPDTAQKTVTVPSERSIPTPSSSIRTDTASIEEAVDGSRQSRPSTVKGVTIIVILAGMSFLSDMNAGLLTGSLPHIAKELGLAPGFLLWPASAYALAAGCSLLVFGSIGDVFGAKPVWLIGCWLYIVFTIASGLSRTGAELITFRALLGISGAMFLPTTVGFITKTFPKGTWRNVAFASYGMGQPLGYAVGLLLGGIFTDTAGWRWGFFLSAILNFCFAVAASFVLPSVYQPSAKKWPRRLMEDIDWVGAVVLSTALGLLMYVLAVVTSSYKSFSDPQNIAMLVISILLLASFPVWMDIQVRRARPAVIPNKLWRNSAFTTICMAGFLCWGSLTAIEYFTVLYFQRVLFLSALQSSLRFLPHVIAGMCTNIATGYLISKVNVRTLAVVSAAITMTAGPLMATVNVHSSYWYAAFWALLLSPINTDVLFTVSNLITSNAFPSDVQSLAGGVVNQIAQFGSAVGLAITAAVAASLTEHSQEAGTDALMQGYRAAFWTIFAATATVMIVTFIGFRKSGIAGRKED